MQLVTHGPIGQAAPTGQRVPAPLSPPSSPSSTPPMSADAVLDELVRVVSGARGAVLATVDGYAVAASSTSFDEASQAAMVAAALGLAHQLVGIGGGSELRQLVVDHDSGLLLLWPIGARRVLAMVTARDVDQSVLRTFVQARATCLVGGAA